MKALIVSTSEGFLEGDAAGGDTLARHELYLERLRALEPDSELRVLVLRKDRAGLSPWRAAGALQTAGVGARGLTAALRLGAMLALPPASLFGAWRPDLVTSQSPFEDGLFSLLLARRLGARHLAQVHFRHAMIATDFRPPVRRLLPPLVLGATDRIRFVGELQAREFAAAYRLARRRTLVVPVPMMIEAAAADTPPAGERPPIVLSVGRLVGSKRMDLWLAAAARIAEAVPEARFVIAGDGPTRDETAALASRLPLTDRVEFVGHLEPAALGELYGRAAMLLVTSDTDAFGRVLVEAGAHGTPVVATACGGPEEILLEGETGFLRPRGDVPALAETSVALLCDEALRTRLGEAARLRVRSLYGATALADRLMGAWVDLVQSGRH